jgi:hypothetical protein
MHLGAAGRRREERDVSEFEFSLIFTVSSGAMDDVDALVERLGAAGCDDALVGVGRWGRLALAFSREAVSASAALTSALADVRGAEPGAQLVEAAPDLVGLTDVAALLGVTRQNVRKLILACDALAPAPVHEGRPSIWRLAKILAWLRDEKQYRVPDLLLETADATLQVNLAVEARDADRDVQEELAALLA